MSTADVIVSHDDDVAVITLNRPAARNALTPAMWAELAAQIETLDADDAVSSMVLTGADPAFCAGFDLAAMSSEDPDERRARLGAPSRFAGMVPSHTTPIIGAINGAAMTGGFELALGCDILIGSDRARFCDTHGRVGVLPGGGMTVLLPLRIGQARARLLSLSAMPIDATTAYAWGLLDFLVGHDELIARARELAHAIAAIPREVRTEITALYNRGQHLDVEDALWHEQGAAKAWMLRSFDLGGLSARRDGIIEAGRATS